MRVPSHSGLANGERVVLVVVAGTVEVVELTLVVGTVVVGGAGNFGSPTVPEVQAAASNASEIIRRFIGPTVITV